MSVHLFDKKDVLIWAPSLPSECFVMLTEWIEKISQEGFRNINLILNGFNSETVCNEFLGKLEKNSVQVEWVSGKPSIGSCQTLILHKFLKSNAKFLCRIDPDLQFPIPEIEKLLKCLTDTQCDLIVAQRDEASVGGKIRLVANFVLRFLALKLNIWGDPNSGFYVMNRKAASFLCSVPFPQYPEPRMFSYLRETPVIVSSQIVPTFPRRFGTTSIRGFLTSFRVFLESLFEFLSWNQCK